MEREPQLVPIESRIVLLHLDALFNVTLSEMCREGHCREWWEMGERESEGGKEGQLLRIPDSAVLRRRAEIERVRERE